MNFEERIDDILDSLEPYRVTNSFGGMDYYERLPRVRVDDLKSALLALLNEARIDGRRIQSEADYDKLGRLKSAIPYLTYLEGQIASHKYELSELQAANQPKDSDGTQQ